MGSVFLDVGRSLFSMAARALEYIFILDYRRREPNVLMREPSRIFYSGICEFSHCFLTDDARIN